MVDQIGLIAEMEDVRQQMRSLLPRLDPAIEVFSQWGLKEIIGHISGWEIVTLRCVQSLLEDQVPALIDDQSIDAHNADFINQRAGLSFAAVCAEWEQVRAALLQAMERLPQDVSERQIEYPWRQHGTVARMLAIIAEHEAEHLRDLEGLVPSPGIEG